MTSYQLRLLAAFSRTDEFFKSTGANLLSGPKNLDLIQELGGIIAKLKEISPAQKRNPKIVRSSAGEIKVLSDELRHELLKVARTARALSDEAPELRLKFAMPRSPGHLALRKAAKAVITNSSPEVRTLFIEAELQSDYLDLIAERLEKFEFALSNKTDGRKVTSSATSEVAATFKRGMMVLRKLDAAVRNRVAEGPILNSWRLARSVELLHRPPPKYRRKLLQNTVDAPKADEGFEQQPPAVELEETVSEITPPEPFEELSEEPSEKQFSEPSKEVGSSAHEENSIELPVVAPVTPAPPIEVAVSEEIPAAAALREEEQPVPSAPVPKPAKKPRLQVQKPIQDDLFGGFGIL